MLNSRDTGLLKPYVRYLCELLIEKCAAEGIKLIVTSTLRDDEYQRSLYEQGRSKPGQIVTNLKQTGTHGFGIGFDIAQNVKGHEYDIAVLKRVGAIGKSIGLEWGGEFKTIVDTPHFQYTGGLTIEQLRNGKLPSFPPIPVKGVSAKDKEIIQKHCNFSDPQGVWDMMDKHPYAAALYTKWAKSYEGMI